MTFPNTIYCKAKNVLLYSSVSNNALPRWCSAKEPACQCRRHKGILPHKQEDEECSEEVVKSSIWGSSSVSVFTFGQISLSFPDIRPVLGHSWKMHVHFLPRWILAQSFVGCLASSLMRRCHLLFELRAVFLCLHRFPWPLDLRSGHFFTLTELSSCR